LDLVKLPIYRTGLPGKEISFYIVPLDPHLLGNSLLTKYWRFDRNRDREPALTNLLTEVLNGLMPEGWELLIKKMLRL